MRKGITRLASAVTFLILLLLGAALSCPEVALAQTQPKDEAVEVGTGARAETGDIFRLKERPYADVLADLRAEGLASALDVDITVPAWRYAAAQADVRVAEEMGGEGPALVWAGEEGWVEWEVHVPKSGLYNIELRYYPLPGRRASIQRDLKIDGEYPFAEAKKLIFQRTWRDAGPPATDNRGDHVRPRQVEVPMWRTVRLEDADAMHDRPFLFYLSAGKHRLRMGGIREPIVLKYLRICPGEQIPAYGDVLKEYRRLGYEPVQNAFVKIQAEDAALKSDPTIRREYGEDPLSEPISHDHRLLSEFGGLRWRRGGQFVSWKFSVPKTGLYQIAMRVWQPWSHEPIYREIRIDGKVPFQEMLQVPFREDPGWRMQVLADRCGEPYLFYLEEGEHTLTMTVKVGPIAPVIWSMEQVQRTLSMVGREVIMLTGSNPDPNMEWELDRQIPDLIPTLESVVRKLEATYADLVRVSTKPSSVANNLKMVASQLKSMIANPDSIPTRIEQLANSQAQLGQGALGLRNHPLQMDYILITSPGARLPRARATIGEQLARGVREFLRSFRKDYSGVGSTFGQAGGGIGETTLNVWIARGRDWAEIIKDLIEEDFTPRTGVRVNVNIMPAGDIRALLLSAVAGRAPDIAMGVDANFPVEFAIRGALEPGDKYRHYPEVTKRFRPGALVPFRYRGASYALPEEQNFTMLFYRKDILGELGLTPPETWDDVYGLMSTLHQNGLDFYYPYGLFTPFLFQHGGNYYTPDGLRSALDTPEALAAFKEWTGLYTSYKVPTIANFYMRMRTGEMPIGIADYSTYVLLSTAAPEITGWWEMRPMPGRRLPDGRIDRSTGGTSRAVMMFRQSRHKEAAWELIKWWTSTEVQVRFGTELEALLGVEARWNSANVEALKELPWPRKDIEAVLEQWEWFREQPVVLGGYYTSRHVINAWNRVVLEGWNPREALEQAVEDIDRELRKKQEEFGVFATGAGADTKTETETGAEAEAEAEAGAGARTGTGIEAEAGTRTGGATGR